MSGGYVDWVVIESFSEKLICDRQEGASYAQIRKKKRDNAKAPFSGWAWWIQISNKASAFSRKVSTVGAGQELYNMKLEDWVGALSYKVLCALGQLNWTLLPNGIV